MHSNRKFILLSLLLLLFVSMNDICAQHREIVQSLKNNTSGYGTVAIYEDEAISSVIGRMRSTEDVYVSPDGNTRYVKMRGFKIQAFSGNNQQRSKNEAYQKRAQIKSSYPNLEATVMFDSPMWRLRVGNFRTREEAQEKMREIARAFPSFGKEMYVVVSEVRIPVE